MKKNNILKKTLWTALSTTCSLATLSTIAINVNNNGNSSLGIKEKNINMSNDEINNNPNFKVDLSLIDSDQKLVVVKENFKNNFPLDVHPNGYWTYDYYEKSYDGGKTFVKAEPLGTVGGQKNQFGFAREDRSYDLRKVVDWNSEYGFFSSFSKTVRVSKKLTTSVVKVKNETEKAKFRINLNGINSGSEVINFKLEKQYLDKTTIIDSSKGYDLTFIQITPEIKIDEKGVYYYETTDLQREILNSTYKFTYKLISDDKTYRVDTVEFTVEQLDKNFKIDKFEVKEDTKELTTIKVNFNKYSIVNDYVVSFVEVDSNGNVIENGHKPFVKNNGNNEYSILKTDESKNYKIVISSKLLNSTITSSEIISIAKKEIDNKPGNGGNNNNGSENNGNNNGGNGSNGENNNNGGNGNNNGGNQENKPNDNNKPELNNPDILNNSKNSFNATSSIAVITILSIITLIAICCSIIMFMNSRKKDKLRK